MTTVGAMAFGVEEHGRRAGAAAVEALYRAEARNLLGMLVAYTGDRALAEDLVQEAFLRVQRTWDRVRQPERAVSYLRATAFNLARSSFRRKRPRVDAPGFVDSPEDGLVLSEDQRAVVDAIRRLPRQQRACVVLRYYTELGIDDIADTLGLSPNTVKTHLVRALDALEVALGGLR
jgi:RNA polymerase sigma-70 factor (sigma-E family)